MTTTSTSPAPSVDEIVRRWRSFHQETTGHLPFAWQDRMLVGALADGAWPESLCAPTGAGKSTVLWMHVFANAAIGHGWVPAAITLPRRLFAVVNRRALVDAQLQQAQKLAAALSDPGAHRPMTALVADGLRLRGGPRAADQPLLVGSLRGGITLSRRWREEPTLVQIVCATPAMWGSRALFRGYRAAASARPQEAALSVLDSLVMVDEAHLNQQLVTTARRVAEFTAGRSSVPGLSVLAVTATPGADTETSHELRVGLDDLEADPALRRRLAAPKQLTVLRNPKPPQSGSADPMIVAEVTQLCAQRSVGDPPVLVVLNTVAHAVAVAKKFQKARALLLVGPLRGADTAALITEHPGLFTSDPAAMSNLDDVEVLVATQAVEVGIDLDAFALVTELAPATALVQRAGRVNRTGTREHGQITVAVHPRSIASPVYSPLELTEALEWLSGPDLAEDGFGPVSLLNHPAPPARPDRLSVELLGADEVGQLAMTSAGALFTEPDLTMWLDDQMRGERPTAAVVVRADPWLACRSTEEEALARQMLAAEGRPDEAERFVAPVHTVRDTLESLPPGTPGFIVPASGSGRPAPAELRTLDTDPALRARQVRRDDVVVLTTKNPITIAGVLHAGIKTADLECPEPVPMGMISGSAHGSWRYGPQTPAPMRAALAALGEDPRDRTALDRLRESTAALTEQQAQGLDDLLDRLDPDHRGTPPMIVTAAATAKPDAQEDEPPVPAWVVVTVDEVPDESIVSTGAGRSRSPVRLDRHGHDVAVATAELARSLALDPHTVAALEIAGLYHDTGKADPRFQRHRLGNQRPLEGPDAVVVAKSTLGPVRAIAAATDTSVLPRGWRHELLSAAYLWARYAHDGADRRQRELMAGSDDRQIALATRLVGTSHGVGRGLVPPGSCLDALVDEHTPIEVAVAADELFGRHRWHRLVADTTAAAGSPWHAAFLESLVRIADHHVSAEGH